MAYLKYLTALARHYIDDHDLTGLTLLNDSARHLRTTLIRIATTERGQDL